MPVEVASMPRGRVKKSGTKFDSRVVVHPLEQTEFLDLGLTSPEAFLAIPGEIVSGHPDRHVMRVVLGNGRTAYLKREHRIRFKDCLCSWWNGRGWSSKSVREGRILGDLQKLDQPAPRWLAFGEDGKGRAFLLLEEVTSASGERRGVSPTCFEVTTSGERRGVSPTCIEDARESAQDLRRIWLGAVDRHALSIQLGKFCAELHESGVDHPDLCAKHLLIDGSTIAITLLDWPRARISKSVSWPHRIRALALLLVTIPGLERSHAARFLWAYLRVVRSRRRQDLPTFAKLARQIQRAVTHLLGRRGVREQRQPPLAQAAQRLVWLDEEALCAIPEVVADLDPAEVRKMLYDPARNGQSLALANKWTARLQVGRHRPIIRRLIARVRGKAWRSLELRKARLLFHLERHHVDASKLFAYGQRCGVFQAEAFLLYEQVDAVPLQAALQAADEDMRHLLCQRLALAIDRLHEAGCEVRTIESLGIRDADRNATIVVSDPDRLSFRKHLSARRRERDHRSVARSMIDYCGSDEIRGFLDRAAENRA